VPTRFDRDTAVTRTDEWTFEARLDPGWSVVRGPNGGYLAAIILRALLATVDDPARVPRSFTTHYASPPRDNDVVSITTAIERQGRSLTSCTARVHQHDRLVGLAIAAFSAPRPGPEFCDVMMPSVPGPDDLPSREPPPEAPPIASRWHTRWAIGSPPVPDAPRMSEAVSGGWIRPEDPHLLDAPLVAALTDAWIPPIFSRIEPAFVVPTVDLTIHFRATLPAPTASPDDWAFVLFRTNVAAEGFIEEDGQVWSGDGTLLAQSRQLAVVMPLA